MQTMMKTKMHEYAHSIDINTEVGADDYALRRLP
jgi:hypothetical protein